MFKNKFLTFILFFVITYSASLIGGLATINFKEPWYSLLNKPSFNPPDLIFAPVWTTLYLMMTISIWIFWHNRNRDMNTVYIYFINLIFNTTWSVIFFVFHNKSNRTWTVCTVGLFGSPKIEQKKFRCPRSGTGCFFYVAYSVQFSQ